MVLKWLWKVCTWPFQGAPRRARSPRGAVRVATRERIPASLREEVWNVYVGYGVGLTKCPVCLHRDMTPFHFHCGHVVARALGGPTTVENLRPVCSVCNVSMGTLHMQEFMATFYGDRRHRVPARMKL